jgi:hypothetical protein
VRDLDLKGSTSITPSPKTVWAGRSISGVAVLTCCIQLRVEHPIFQMLFPVIVGSLIWAGVYVRDARLRGLIPVRRRLDGGTLRSDVGP